MPLRIEARVSSAENRLILDGWLNGPEVTEFEHAAASLGLPLQIDLAHVAGADRGGIAALHAQRARGATLANASRYVELLLDAHLASPADEDAS
jgi:hypothetical protein